MRRMVFVVVLLCVVFTPTAGSWAMLEEMSGGGQGWNTFYFEPGQMFIYDLEGEVEGDAVYGEIGLWFSDAGEGQLDIMLKGEFDGESFSSYATGEQGNIDEIYMNFAMAIFQDLPDNLQAVVWSFLWHPWMDTPLYGYEPKVGWEGAEVDVDGEPFSFRVVEKKSYAGREGYVIEIEDFMIDTMEICIDPGLPLPLSIRSRFFLDDALWGASWDVEDYDAYIKGLPVVSIDLNTYEEDAVAPEMAVPARLLAQEFLKGVVDHFREQGFEVGDAIQPKAYGMMGAIGGFGVDVEGGPVELYLFDPETAQEDTLEKLEDARVTGIFDFEAIGMEIPVFFNGNVMLTGLEFGDFYKHPARDTIIEVFKEF